MNLFLDHLSGSRLQSWPGQLYTDPAESHERSNIGSLASGSTLSADNGVQLPRLPPALDEHGAALAFGPASSSDNDPQPPFLDSRASNDHDIAESPEKNPTRSVEYDLISPICNLTRPIDPTKYHTPTPSPGPPGPSRCDSSCYAASSPKPYRYDLGSPDFAPKLPMHSPTQLGNLNTERAARKKKRRELRGVGGKSKRATKVQKHVATKFSVIVEIANVDYVKDLGAVYDVHLKNGHRVQVIDAGCYTMCDSVATFYEI